MTSAMSRRGPALALDLPSMPLRLYAHLRPSAAPKPHHHQRRLASRWSKFKPKPKPQKSQKQKQGGIILEKPDVFRPPSHGNQKPGSQRKRRPLYDGPELSREQQTKRYPNMMPAPDTLAFKILTTKGLHVWITLSTLVSMAGYVTYKDFATTTEYWHLVPPVSTAASHPLSYISQVAHVYGLHSRRQSELLQEKRMKKLDDVDKSIEFRRYQGLEPGWAKGGKKIGADGEVEDESEPITVMRQRRKPGLFGISWN